MGSYLPHGVSSGRHDVAVARAAEPQRLVVHVGVVVVQPEVVANLRQYRVPRQIWDNILATLFLISQCVPNSIWQN